MNAQHTLLAHDTPAQTWNEELSRAKKYKEATQKRRTEKLACSKAEKLKKALQVGRLKIEA